MLPYGVIRYLPRFPPPGRHIVPLVLSVISAQCGSTVAPSPPPAITVTCPASIVVPSPSGLAVTVPFALPVTAGGTAPFTTVCTPPSGAIYSIGTTAVACSVADAKQQTANCGFSVTVTAPP